MSGSNIEAKKVTREAVREALLQLQGCGLTISTAVSEKDCAKAYCEALVGLSQPALSAVTRKLVRGEYPKFRVFIPIPPEFAGLVRDCDRLHRGSREDQRIIYETRDAVRRLRQNRTIEEKAYAKSVVESFRCGHNIEWRHLSTREFVEKKLAAARTRLPAVRQYTKTDLCFGGEHWI